MPPKPTISQAEFAAMAARAGLKLDATQLAEMHSVYGYFEEMQARVRKPRGLEAEPAHVFPVSGSAER